MLLSHLLKRLCFYTHTKLVVSLSRTHVEHSRIMSSEGHNNNGSKYELVVLKIVKGKGQRKSRESARLKELT